MSNGITSRGDILLYVGAGLPFCLRSRAPLLILLLLLLLRFARRDDSKVINALTHACHRYFHWFFSSKIPRACDRVGSSLLSLFWSRHVRIKSHGELEKRKIRVITLCSTWEATESQRAVFQRLSGYCICMIDGLSGEKGKERRSVYDNPQSRGRRYGRRGGPPSYLSRCAYLLTLCGLNHSCCQFNLQCNSGFPFWLRSID